MQHIKNQNKTEIIRKGKKESRKTRKELLKPL